MERFENLREALQLAKQDIVLDNKEVTKYEVGLALNVVLNVFLLIASFFLLNLNLTVDDGLKYILQITLISVGFLTMIVSIVFIMIGLLHKKYLRISSTTYLKCNEDGEEYLLKILFDYQNTRKNNLEVIHHLRKFSLASLISFVISILSYIALIISLLV